MYRYSEQDNNIDKYNIIHNKYYLYLYIHSNLFFFLFILRTELTNKIFKQSSIVISEKKTRKYPVLRLRKIIYKSDKHI